MKLFKFLFSCSFVLIVFNVFGQQNNSLSNESIIEMYTKGLPVSIIASRLKTAQNTFDISTDALIRLTEKKIPEDLINAMIDAAADATRHFVVIDPNNPNDMHDLGIYYIKKNGTKIEVIPL